MVKSRKHVKYTAPPLLTKKQLFCLINYVVYIIIGLLVFKYAWNMTFYDALHNAVIIYTTVGYGITEKKIHGRKGAVQVYDSPGMMCFLIVYITWGVAVIMFAIHVVLELLAEKTKNKKSISDCKFIAEGAKPDHDAEQKESIWDNTFFWLCLDLFVTIAGAVFIMWLDIVEEPEKQGIAGNPLGIPYYNDLGKDITGFEGKPWPHQLLIAAYFGIVTGSSVGFGLLEPQSDFARLFCFFWVPTTICLTANTFNYFLQWFMSLTFDVEKEEKQNFKMKIYEFLSVKNLFEHMDMEGDGQIHQNEFILQVLLNACDIDIKNVNIIKHFIQKLDTSNDGYLDRAEFKFEDRIKILQECLYESDYHDKQL